MSLRMVPVDALFRKMTRLVRDLSKQSDKAVNLQLDGTEIELDKTIIEKLGDPLIHMIRNAVDHGIEDDPDERTRAGKPAEATITLRAQQRGANILITVSDDGRGMKRDVLLKRGLAMGLIQDAETATDTDIFSLIFAPGFSTARVVTDVSGRGVGMDVVRRDISALRGSVTVESTPGRGTTFTLALPLTLAIIDGMSVRIGTETYIIPMLSIVECIRPEPSLLHRAVDRADMLEFRGRHLSLIRCSSLFKIASSITDPCEGIAVIVEDGDRQLALLVDSLLDQQQAVVKPLSDSLGTVRGVSAASILGNGQPALVLDIGSIMQMVTGRTDAHVMVVGAQHQGVGV
jgi:two-component system chemotaxis sensor kinase CheA